MRLNPRFERVFVMLTKAATPMACADLAERTGNTTDSMASILRQLKDKGLVVRTKLGNAAMWAIAPKPQDAPLGERPKSTIPLTAHLKIVLDMIVASRSISCAALASRYGCTNNHMQTLLRRLRERGVAVCIGGGESAVWAASEMAEEARAAHKKACIDGHNARQREYARRKKELAQAENDRFAQDRPRQVTVPAHQCPPIRPPAPMSVFNMARTP